MEAATLFSAKGLVVVVTGGGTGIGLAIAKALELNGAERVYILGRRLEVLENAAKQSKFGRITPLACDITSKPQLQATAERISQESGRVDVLVNNAGVLAERHEAVPSDSIEALQELLWQEDPQKWSQQFEVNVTGTFFTIIAFLKLLKNANEHWKVQNQGEGVSARRLSQVISVVGISAHHRGMSNLAGYAASKAALLHLMGLLSTLLAPLDVRCYIRQKSPLDPWTATIGINSVVFYPQWYRKNVPEMSKTLLERFYISVDEVGGTATVSKSSQMEAG